MFTRRGGVGQPPSFSAPAPAVVAPSSTLACPEPRRVHSFAPERELSRSLSITCALFACLPGMTPRATLFSGSSLVTRHSPLVYPEPRRATIPCRIRTYRRTPRFSRNQPQGRSRKSFRIRTYRHPFCKSFRIRTYEKTGWGIHVAQPLLAVLRRATVDPQAEPVVGSSSDTFGVARAE